MPPDGLAQQAEEPRNRTLLGGFDELVRERGTWSNNRVAETTSRADHPGDVRRLTCLTPEEPAEPETGMAITC